MLLPRSRIFPENNGEKSVKNNGGKKCNFLSLFEKSEKGRRNEGRNSVIS